MKYIIDKIVEWADRPLNVRYNVLLAIIFAALSFIVINQQNKINSQKNEYITHINSCDSRLDDISDFYEKKVIQCYENFIEYLKENEKEMKQIKEVVDENVN